MSRIQPTFQRLQAAGRKALVTFITAGDPMPSATVPIMHTLVAAGADILELGVPFSDPVADGPVIQRASERALAQYTSLSDVLAMVREFRTQDNATPVVLMGYLNPIEAMGYAEFAQRARAAGIDGVLTVDVPPEESGELTQTLRMADLDPIYLIAPTSDEARIHCICALASGFVYYVSMKGVTGASHLDTAEVGRRLALIKSLTPLPVGAGFGIKDGPTAAAMGAQADAVIVGSALVERIERLGSDLPALHQELGALARELRQAIDGAR